MNSDSSDKSDQIVEIDYHCVLPMEYNFFVEYKTSIQTLDFATYEYWNDAKQFGDSVFR